MTRDRYYWSWAHDRAVPDGIVMVDLGQKIMRMNDDTYRKATVDPERISEAMALLHDPGQSMEAGYLVHRGLDLSDRLDDLILRTVQVPGSVTADDYAVMLAEYEGLDQALLQAQAQLDVIRQLIQAGSDK